jgi:tRNA pseudouridine55 synthase
MSTMEREIGVSRGGARIPAWSGLLCVDKPTGVTSHDAVLRVRRRLHDRGAGHLGTLDPGASGLLVVALGAATRCIQVWQGGEKTYEATARFGVTTDTQDLEGTVLERRDVGFDEAAIREATGAFVGAIEQIPPMVSALKVGGERLHRLARQGRTVNRAPRRVRVLAWEWLSFDLPEARFRIRCSGGTYVRTLVHDLGHRLGAGAALAALRRTRSEPFGIERSVPLAALDALTREKAIARAGVPLDDALHTLPSVTLDEEDAAAIGYGARPALAVGTSGAERDRVALGPRSIVIRDAGGRALAMGQLLPDPESAERVRVAPQVVFPWAVRQGREPRGE